MSSGGNDRRLQCPDCTRSFARPSHLNRHQLTHLTTAQKNHLPCQRCNKIFSRRDVLLRHLRSAHDIKDQNARSTRRSCVRCVAKKLRCERTDPCSACLKFGAHCEYSSNSASDALVDRSTSDMYCPIPTGDESDESYDVHGHPASLPTPMDDASSTSPACDLDAMLGGASAVSNSLSGFQSSRLADERSDLTGPCHTIDNLDGRGHGFHDIGVPQSLDTMFPNPDINIPMGGFALSPSYSFSMQPSFHTGGVDWLSFDIDDQVHQPQSDVVGVCDVPQNWVPAPAQRVPHTKAFRSTQTEDSVHPVLEQDLAGRRSPFSNTQSLNSSTLPWPFDQSSDSTPHRYRLPPLRDVLNGDQRAIEPIHTTILDEVVDILSESRLPQLAQLRSGNAIQAFGLLQRLIDAYFTRFHDIQAIIHKPTWDMSSCPTVFLAAMACLGALLSDSKEDTELSCGLSEICSTMINWMGASDGTNYLDISYLNALCLHQIYSLGSGNRQLYQNADRSRGILIGGLRGIGLLRSRFSVDLEDKPEKIAKSLDEQALSQAWRTWIARESGRRAAWAAFEYDCSLCTLTSRRGVVDLSELPSILPCSESIWSAGSAHAWFALQSRSGVDSLNPSLSTIIKLTLAGKDIPSFVGSWAKRLCSQVLGRLLWDLKQLEVLAMPEHCGLVSMLNGHRESKKSLLSGLNNLTDSLRKPSSTSDLISYNISSLLCHYSHLYAASDVLDMIIYIVRNVISSVPDKHRGIEVARKRLKLTFAKDPETARRLCWHAAQMVVIANEYLVSAPCEIMRVFMGYIFILAYAAYGPRSVASGGSDSVQLDMPSYESSQKSAVVNWIHTGGPASLGSVEDIGVDGCVPFISRDAQSMLQKLQCWGLAERFVKVFNLLETKGF